MLRKSKGNMYGFVTHTWNTIKGKCPHKCSYCYVKKWGSQPELHFDEKELKTDLGTGNTIFVGSSCDMFADAIPPEWVIRTLQHCEKYPGNTYFLQTKNPKGFMDYGVYIASLDKIILCTTIETNLHFDSVFSNDNIMGDAPDTQERKAQFLRIPIKEKMITIEPIMDFDLKVMVRWMKESDVIQVNIGADSQKSGLPEPSKEKVLELISELEKFTTVHQKSNLKRLLK